MTESKESTDTSEKTSELPQPTAEDKSINWLCAQGAPDSELSRIAQDLQATTQPGQPTSVSNAHHSVEVSDACLDSEAGNVAAGADGKDINIDDPTENTQVTQSLHGGHLEDAAASLGRRLTGRLDGTALSHARRADSL